MILAVYLFILHFTPGAVAQLIPPDVGAYHGAYADFGPMASAVSAEKIREFEASAQKKVAWAYFANDWLDGVIEYPEQNVSECIKANVIPYIRLMPWTEAQTKATQKDPYLNMDKILSGEHDFALKVYARKVKTAGVHFMLEFGPEVNGDWFPWNGKWNGGGSKDKYGDPEWPDGPEKFRNAFRHIVDIFRAEGAKNITWILHLDTAASPNVAWNDAKYYYAGDDYVDWIGLSVFGAQLPNHEWLQFISKMKNFEKQLDAISTTKPVLISEFAVIEDKNDPERKAKWIKQALQSIEKGLFKRIKGINYWNSPGWLENQKASFKIDTSAQALKAYRDGVASDFWKTEGVVNE